MHIQLLKQESINIKAQDPLNIEDTLTASINFIGGHHIIF